MIFNLPWRHRHRLIRLAYCSGRRIIMSFTPGISASSTAIRHLPSPPQSWRHRHRHRHHHHHLHRHRHHHHNTSLNLSSSTSRDTWIWFVLVWLSQKDAVSQEADAQTQTHTHTHIRENNVKSDVFMLTAIHWLRHRLIWLYQFHHHNKSKSSDIAWRQNW